MPRLIACLVLLAASAGCNGSPHQAASSSAAPGEGRALQIAVIPKGTTHEFWKSVHAGAERAAKELGNVEIIWKGPLREDDREQQINVVQDFITGGVDGICLAPLDSQALIASVLDAKAENIPTVIFDSGLDDEEALVSYVATDNYRGGVLAAEQMAEALGGKGDVILLRYNPGSESTHQREEGFLDTLKERFPDIRILSSDQYAGTTPEMALDKAQQVLQNYGDEVDGIFAVCEPNGAGVLGALKGTGLAGKVKFIAFDPSETLIQAMRDGNVHGIVLQDPVTMGYLAVKTIVEHLQGKPVERRVSTGEYVATPDNMETREMQKLLDPVKFEGT